MDALKQLGFDQALSLQWATEAPAADQDPSSSHSNGRHVRRKLPANGSDVGSPETQPGAPSFSSTLKARVSQPPPCIPGPPDPHSGRQSPAPAPPTAEAAHTARNPHSCGASDPGSDGKQQHPSALPTESHAAGGSQLQGASAGISAKELTQAPHASAGSPAADAALRDRPSPLPGVEQLLVQLLRYDTAQRHREFLQVCTTQRWPLKLQCALQAAGRVGPVLQSKFGRCLAAATCFKLPVGTWKHKTFHCRAFGTAESAWSSCLERSACRPRWTAPTSSAGKQGNSSAHGRLSCAGGPPFLQSSRET